MPAKPRPSTRSSNRKTAATNFPKQKSADPKRARAHRNDTWEAREQTRRTPKTHPTRNASSSRKDSMSKVRRGDQ